MLLIVSRAFESVKPAPLEPAQPVYQGQIHPSASSLPAPQDMADCPEGAALRSVAEGFLKQLPQALSSWPELEGQKAREAQLEFTAAAMACTADTPLPAQPPGLEGLSSHCRRAIFTAGGSADISAPAAALAGALVATAAAISEPKGVGPMLSGLKSGASMASGGGSQPQGTAALGWALSLHALYAVLPLANLPPLQHNVEDLPTALAKIFNAASDRQVTTDMSVKPICLQAPKQVQYALFLSFAGRPQEWSCRPSIWDKVTVL